MAPFRRAIGIAVLQTIQAQSLRLFIPDLSPIPLASMPFPTHTILLAQQTYSGINGFLGTRASIMLDIVFLAMFLVIPAMWYSIQLAKKKQYDLHKKVQLALATTLLIAVGAFEIDMQFLTAWEERAAASPFFNLENKWGCTVGISLLIHLAFAIPTLLLWIVVIVQGLRKFPSPAKPSSHSHQHKKLGKLAGVGMFMTSVTGWIFYYLAFVAVG